MVSWVEAQSPKVNAMKPDGAPKAAKGDVKGTGGKALDTQHTLFLKTIFYFLQDYKQKPDNLYVDLV